MSKTRLTVSLSRSSFQNLAQQVKLYKERLNKGVELGVQEATKQLYDLIIANCISNNLANYQSDIHWEYDETTKTGRVYTDQIIIIFNEFGTGREGKQDSWATELGYTVNASGKGDKGWWYPTTLTDPNPYKWVDKDGQLRALTHGLPSKHIFYNALKEIEPLLAKDIGLNIARLTGDMY